MITKSMSANIHLSDSMQQNLPGTSIIAESLEEALGYAPMIKLNRISPLCQQHRLYMKMDSCCLTGSIKDKNAAYLIRKAELTGLLQPGGTIIESSSGNFGIALAALGAAKGYQVIIVIDAKTPPPVIRMLKAYGATLEEVPLNQADAAGSMQKARMAHALKLSQTLPNNYYPCQHLNPDNPSVHEKLTAKEIERAFPTPPDAIVIGISTSGQFSGISRYFKRKYPDVSLIAVDVSGSAVLGQPRHSYKMTGLGLSFSPPMFDPQQVDFGYNVQDQIAFSMCQQLAKTEGLLLGGSTGAIVSAALAYVGTMQDTSKHLVMINPDRGDRYLETLFCQDWLSSNGFQTWNHSELLEQVHQLKPVLAHKGLHHVPA